jgi:hypothetical protein
MAQDHDTTTKAGIDYGLGLSNIDRTTGIRYGVISPHSVNPDALDDVWQNGRDLTWEAALEEAQAEYQAEVDALPEAEQGRGRTV